MNHRAPLCVALTVAVAAACGTSTKPSTFEETVDASLSDAAAPIDPTFGDAPDGGGPSLADIAVEELRLTPDGATLDVSSGPARITLRLEARLVGEPGWQDVTARAVFYVPGDANLPELRRLGEFPGSGPTFVTAAGAHGGVVRVRALVRSRGQVLSADGALTLTQRRAESTIAGMDAAEAEGRFRGAAPQPGGARRPLVVYPFDGTLMPPNMGKLPIHFLRGATSQENDLFEVELRSVRGSVSLFTTCAPPPGAREGCGVDVAEDAFRIVAESNRGEEAALVVRGARRDQPGPFWESAPLRVRFAEQDLAGALYYWDTTQEGIWRFDFGSAQRAPEPFLKRGSGSVAGEVAGCPGCHTLSRDGRKMALSLDGIGSGDLVFIADMSQPRTPQLAAASPFFAVNGVRTDDPATTTNRQDDKGPTGKRIQFAAFDPTGDRFVAVYGDTRADPSCRAGTPPGADCFDGEVNNNNLATGLRATCDGDDCKTLWFHDGATGRRTTERVVLPFEPSHVDWSPDGRFIAMTRVGLHNVTQRPSKASLAFLEREGGAWSAPRALTPVPSDVFVTYAPVFAPSSDFVLFSQSRCSSTEEVNARRGYRGEDCDGDADPSARTFALNLTGTPARPGGAPILLAEAGRRGLRDVTADLGDTFPRFSPRVRKEKGRELFWVTVSSRRWFGLRPPKVRRGGQEQDAQWLWMFAIDPERIRQGLDGSSAPFLVPVQNLETSNHLGQWAERIVSDAPPPPAPEPPGPVPPPPVR